MADDFRKTKIQRALEAYLERTGEAVYRLSQRAGLGGSAVRQILNGESRSPRSVTVAALAKAMGVPVSDLIEDATPNATHADDPVDPRDFVRSLPRDVPVYGYAHGGLANLADGTGDLVYDFDMADGPVEMAPRPPAVATIRDLFGCYIQGDSMVPWRRSGSLVYVAPHRPVRLGDHVLVELTSEDEFQAHQFCLIKKLFYLSAERVVLGQYNPYREDIEIPRARVARIARILEWEEIAPELT